MRCNNCNKKIDVGVAGSRHNIFKKIDMNKEEQIKFVEGIIKEQEEMIQEPLENIALHNSLKYWEQVLAELKGEDS